MLKQINTFKECEKILLIELDKKHSQYIITYDEKKQLIIWDIEKCIIIKILNLQKEGGFLSSITSRLPRIAYSNQQNGLTTVHRNYEKLENKIILKKNKREAFLLEFQKDLLIICSLDPNIYIWKYLIKELIMNIILYSPVQELRFNNYNRNYLIHISFSGLISSINYKRFKVTNQYKIMNAYFIDTSKNGKFQLILSTEKIYILNNKNKILRFLKLNCLSQPFLLNNCKEIIIKHLKQLIKIDIATFESKCIKDINEEDIFMQLQDDSILQLNKNEMAKLQLYD